MKELYKRLKGHLYSNIFDVDTLEERVKVLVSDLLGTVLYSIFFVIIMLSLEFPIAAMTTIGYGFGVSILLVCLYFKRLNYEKVVYFMTLLLSADYFTIIYFSGGLESPYLISLVTLSSSALWYIGKRQAIINTLVLILGFVILNISNCYGEYTFPNVIPSSLVHIHQNIAILFFILPYFLFIFIYDDSILKRKSLVVEKNKEIKERNIQLNENKQKISAQHDSYIAKKNLLEQSMKYAQKIQQNFQPLESNLKKAFDDAFILYQPIFDVGGDFVWTCKCDSYRVVIVADCTGHGPPAALLTILGHSMLEEIILKEQKFDPARILSELDCQFYNAFNGDIPDGMDISVLVFDDTQQTFSFAGAKQTILYVPCDGEHKMLRGNRSSIGGALDVKPCQKEFDIISEPYQSGDTFYLYSDGFQDQFGEVTDKKYYRKKFIQLLDSISHKEMAYQRNFLSNEFDNWKGNVSQTDDMLVVGIKL